MANDWGFAPNEKSGSFITINVGDDTEGAMPIHLGHLRMPSRSTVNLGVVPLYRKARYVHYWTALGWQLGPEAVSLNPLTEAELTLHIRSNFAKMPLAYFKLIFLEMGKGSSDDIYDRAMKASMDNDLNASNLTVTSGRNWNVEPTWESNSWMKKKLQVVRDKFAESFELLENG